MRGAILTTTVIALALAACGDDGGDASPASVTVLAGDGQTAHYDSAVAISPAVVVRDAAGGLMPGVEVTFTVAAGDGHVSPASVRTDDQGVAAVATWTLGPAPGSNSLDARAGAAHATFSATGVAGPVTTMTLVAGGGQSAIAGTAVAVAPAVRLTDGTWPIAGQFVSFAVTRGGGVVTPDSVPTDADGVATVASWRLGGAGEQELTVSSSGVADVTVAAISQPATLGRLFVVAGEATSAFPLNLASALPVVQVQSTSGNGVPGVTVTFTAGGGGALSYATAPSDVDGYASPGAWRFGASGTQSVQASTPGLAPVTISGVVTPRPATQFDLQLVFLDPQPTDAQKAAFLAAADRWRQVIVGDVPDYPGAIPAGVCASGAPEVPGPIDDVVIFAGVRAIDGPGKVLAQAGPCMLRVTGSLAISGVVIFDQSDLAFLGSLGSGLADVAFHEFAHILGFGTIWQELRVVRAPGTDAVAFTGPAARQAYAALLQAAGAARPASFDVPVENCVGLPNCGPGTRDGHWREPVFGAEIMTGYYNSVVTNPFSVLSAAAMRDLGYVVDDTAVDAYMLPAVLGSLRAGAVGGIAFRESLAPWPIRVVDDGGRVVGEARR